MKLTKEEIIERYMSEHGFSIQLLSDMLDAHRISVLKEVEEWAEKNKRTISASSGTTKTAGFNQALLDLKSFIQSIK